MRARGASCRGIEGKERINFRKSAALAAVAVASSTAANAGRGLWGRGVVGEFWASATIGTLRARPNYPYLYSYYAPTPV
jgi:hypothetical protein